MSGPRDDEGGRLAQEQRRGAMVGAQASPATVDFDPFRPNREAAGRSQTDVSVAAQAGPAHGARAASVHNGFALTPAEVAEKEAVMRAHGEWRRWQGLPPLGAQEAAAAGSPVVAGAAPVAGPVAAAPGAAASQSPAVDAAEEWHLYDDHRAEAASGGGLSGAAWRQSRAVGPAPLRSAAPSASAGVAASAAAGPQVSRAAQDARASGASGASHPGAPFDPRTAGARAAPAASNASTASPALPMWMSAPAGPAAGATVTAAATPAPRVAGAEGHGAAHGVAASQGDGLYVPEGQLELKLKGDVPMLGGRVTFEVGIG